MVKPLRRDPVAKRLKVEESKLDSGNADLVLVDLKNKFKHDRGTYKPGVHARFYIIGWRDTAKKFWRLSQLCKTFGHPLGNRRLFIAQPAWREVAFELMRRTRDMVHAGWVEVYYATKPGDTLGALPPLVMPPAVHGPFECAFKKCDYVGNTVEELRDHLEIHTEPEEPGRESDRPGYCTRCSAACTLITVAGRTYNNTRPFLQLCGTCGAVAPVLMVYSWANKKFVPHLLISGTQVGAITASARDCVRGVKGQRKHGGVEHRWFPKDEKNDWIIDSFLYAATREQEERTRVADFYLADGVKGEFEY